MFLLLFVQNNLCLIKSLIVEFTLQNVEIGDDNSRLFAQEDSRHRSVLGSYVPQHVDQAPLPSKEWNAAHDRKPWRTFVQKLNNLKIKNGSTPTSF